MSKRTCTIEGCERKHQAKGYCITHYGQHCNPDRHKSTKTCVHCGTQYVTTRTGGQYCSLPCRDQAMREQKKGPYRERPPKPPKAKADLRSPLRKALEDGGDVIAAIRPDCIVTPSGCWEWQRRMHHTGYPQVSVAGRTLQVHRLVIEAKFGRSLGSQAAHHVCANSKCVNPDHLQPVTYAENTAEMLARTYMMERIRELETALADFNPSHELLQEVSVPA